MVLIPLYLQPHPIVHIPGWFLMIFPGVATIVNLFFVKLPNTPCNNSFAVVSKAILIVRLAIAYNVILRYELDISWDWKTTFWPYWLSFTL